MEINERELYKLILKVVKEMRNEKLIPNHTVSAHKKDLYIILTDEINDSCLSFLREKRLSDLYNVFTVIPDSIINTCIYRELKCIAVCGEIIKQTEFNMDNLSDFITLFPIVPRSLAVKAALCISDTFETKWIKNCIVNGRKIIMLKQGFEKLTGREPKAYAKRINLYYSMLLEYGIEIIDDIFEIEPNIKQNNVIGQKSKRIITVGEIEKLSVNSKIILNHGDLITDLAQEEAVKLGIELIRNN